MKSFRDYFDTVQTAGSKPSLLHYAFIKICDNGLTAILTVLIIIFIGGGIVLYIYNKEYAANILFDFSKLCLGVFLGLFAGKRSK